MYKKVKHYEIPKREYKSKSLFESSWEWKRMRADIDSGPLRRDEALRIRLSPEDWRRIGLSAERMSGRNTAVGCKAIKTFIQKYLAERGLKYRVRAYYGEGVDNIVVKR